MFNKRFLSSVLVLAFLGAFTLAVLIPGHSQITPPPRKPRIPVGDVVRAPLATLTQLEGIASRIESKKLIALQDDKDMDRLMMEYANGMIEAFNASIENAKEYANSKGAKGSIQLLDDFEKTIPEHKNRVDALGRRYVDWEDDKIPKGDIILGRDILITFPPGVLDEFTRSLSKPALEKYRKLYPDLVKTEPVPKDAEGEGPNLVDFGEATENFENCGSFEPGWASPSLSGSVAAGCAALCIAQNWPACIACIAAVLPQAPGIVQEFQDCWRNCGEHYEGRPWKKWKCRWVWQDYLNKLGCVPRLLLLLG